MKSKNETGPRGALLTPPYDYVPRAYLQEKDQRAALQLVDEQQAPDLEALKKSDPDSYRMVVYSWA